MIVKPGETYYIIAHAYHHYVGTVVELTPRGCFLRDCVKVHSSGRSWSEFFRDGFGADTRFDHVPDGTWVPLGQLPVHPFTHPVPKRSK